MESCGEVSKKKGKVRVRGRVNLAISWKRSVVERNGIKNLDPLRCKGISKNHLGEFRRKRVRLGLGVRLTWPYLGNGAS